VKARARREPAGSDADARRRVRLDVWLDVSCLFRTRSEAKQACTAGRVEINGDPAKPHRLVQAGDALTILRPFGRRQQVSIVRVEERSMPKAEARTLYEDRTPPPTAEEREMRRMERLFRAAHAGGPAPGKRERRALRALRGR
jgi:ribosome-associated heat shock protein Hsp15